MLFIYLLKVTYRQTWPRSREYINVGREAKLLLLTEIGATAAPLAARGVSRLQWRQERSAVHLVVIITQEAVMDFLFFGFLVTKKGMWLLFSVLLLPFLYVIGKYKL